MPASVHKTQKFNQKQRFKTHKELKDFIIQTNRRKRRAVKGNGLTDTARRKDRDKKVD